MSIFFVSDTHFGHNNIISFCNRPFASVQDMNERMVEGWNKTVRDNDVVYHLGDVAFNNYDCIERLRGKIKLVPGNHDLERFKKIAHLFDEILPELSYLKVDPEHRFVLCHYPIESWRREYRYHLHGHSHGTSRPVMNRLDVGVDATKWMAPMHMDDVMQAITVNNAKVMEGKLGL